MTKPKTTGPTSSLMFYELLCRGNSKVVYRTRVIYERLTYTITHSCLLDCTVVTTRVQLSRETCTETTLIQLAPYHTWTSLHLGVRPRRLTTVDYFFLTFCDLLPKPFYGSSTLPLSTKKADEVVVHFLRLVSDRESRSTFFTHQNGDVWASRQEVVLGSLGVLCPHTEPFPFHC